MSSTNYFAPPRTQAKKNQKNMIKKINRNSIKRQVTLDGMMTIGMLENSLRTADFECCEDAEVEAFIGRFKVQCMRDGNVYMEELPKRQKNNPLVRLEHSSLTLGRDGWFYFGFRMPESELLTLHCKGGCTRC